MTRFGKQQLALAVVAITVTSLMSYPAVAQGAQGGPPQRVTDVDNAARSPFQVELCAGVNNECKVPNIFDVPSDRRLVIEYVSGRCIANGITRITADFSTTANGVRALHVVHLVSDALSSGNFFDVTQQMRVYADPDSSVGMGFSLGGGAGPFDGRCNLVLSGYTVTP